MRSLKKLGWPFILAADLGEKDGDDLSEREGRAEGHILAAMGEGPRGDLGFTSRRATSP